MAPVGGAAPGDEDALAAHVRERVAAGDLETALAAAEDGFRQCRADGNARGEAVAHLMLAVVRAGIEDNEPEDTLEVALAAYAALEAVGDQRYQAEALELACDAQLKSGQVSAACESAKLRVSLCSGLGDDPRTVAAQIAFAGALRTSGEFDAALRACKDAERLAESLGDRRGVARARLAASRALLAADDVDEAAEEAKQARKLFADAPDRHGEASALLALCAAQAAAGSDHEAARTAEAAVSRCRAAGDLAMEVDALIALATAKANMNEQSKAIVSYGSLTSLSRAAEVALAAAKARRAKDHACVAAAHFVYARVLLRTNLVKTAWVSAKTAARLFKKVNDGLGRARATLLWAEADLALGMHSDARGNAQTALTLFDKLSDAQGRAAASQVLDQVDMALGIPTQAELEEQQRQELEMQQQYLLQMQAQMPQADGGMPMQVQSMPLDLPTADQMAAAGPAATFKRDGASPLQVGAGMDPQLVRSKVMELAGQIIGDTDDLDLDTPLMEAGMTSNTAVILRDELGKDLPGINLPPTLMFDYPSVSAITDYVIERSQNMK